MAGRARRTFRRTGGAPRRISWARTPCTRSRATSRPRPSGRRGTGAKERGSGSSGSASRPATGPCGRARTGCGGSSPACGGGCALASRGALAAFAGPSGAAFDDGVADERRIARDTGSMSVSSESRHRELGLTDFEYERITELLEREPNEVELAMFSLLWSEHCAYKHSRKLLRRLPTEGPRVLMGPGENAGAVDVGDGHAVAFKVESHNHPGGGGRFPGAPTRVGGSLRAL